MAEKSITHLQKVIDLHKQDPTILSVFLNHLLFLHIHNQLQPFLKAYFEHFPTIDYDPTGSGNFKTIKDILIRVTIKKAVRNSNAVFSKYDVKEGQRPEDVAFEQYGNPNLHWIVLMMNEITNPYYDWPMGLRDLERFVSDST